MNDESKRLKSNSISPNTSGLNMPMAKTVNIVVKKKKKKKFSTKKFKKSLKKTDNKLFNKLGNVSPTISQQGIQTPENRSQESETIFSDTKSSKGSFKSDENSSPISEYCSLQKRKAGVKDYLFLTFGVIFYIVLVYLSIIFIVNITADTQENESWPVGLFFIYSAAYDLTIGQLIMTTVQFSLFRNFYKKKLRATKRMLVHGEKIVEVKPPPLLNTDLVNLLLPVDILACNLDLSKFKEIGNLEGVQNIEKIRLSGSKSRNKSRLEKILDE